MKDLNEFSYPKKDIQLSIVEAQLSQSRIARGVEGEGNEDSKQFIKPTDFDLPLNETLNIIKDYFEIKQPGGSALHQLENSQEI